MRPREPNAEECKDILEDLRLYLAEDRAAGPYSDPVYNMNALGVLSAWLRWKAYWVITDTNETENRESVRTISIK